MWKKNSKENKYFALEVKVFLISLISLKVIEKNSNYITNIFNHIFTLFLSFSQCHLLVFLCWTSSNFKRNWNQIETRKRTCFFIMFISLICVYCLWRRLQFLPSLPSLTYLFFNSLWHYSQFTFSICFL